MKNGWLLLLASIAACIAGDILLGVLGDLINPEASDWYGSIGAIIGFIAPSIVYFGNKL